MNPEGSGTQLLFENADWPMAPPSRYLTGRSGSPSGHLLIWNATQQIRKQQTTNMLDLSTANLRPERMARPGRATLTDHWHIFAPCYDRVARRTDCRRHTCARDRHTRSAAREDPERREIALAGKGLPVHLGVARTRSIRPRPELLRRGRITGRDQGSGARRRPRQGRASSSPRPARSRSDRDQILGMSIKGIKVRKGHRRRCLDIERKYYLAHIDPRAAASCSWPPPKRRRDRRMAPRTRAIHASPPIRSSAAGFPGPNPRSGDRLRILCSIPRPIAQACNAT